MKNESTIEKIKALDKLAEHINPTVIYNEGWMIRLLVMESIIEKLEIEGISFGNVASQNWTSEALIESPFLKAQKYPERHTHPDIIFGDFCVDYAKCGKITLKDPPKRLGIIEAKMGSNLSQRTSYAEKYNQASRSICCLSHVTKDKPDCEIFFIVAAPKKTIEKPIFVKQIKPENIKKQIEERFQLSSIEYLPGIRGQVENCKISTISYESWIDGLKKNDGVEKELNKFYQKCLQHNKIKLL